MNYELEKEKRINRAFRARPSDSSFSKPSTLYPKPFSGGFSLVEILVYLGLMVLILLAIVNMILTMSRAYGFLKLSIHVQTSAVTALDKIVQDARGSQGINVGQSTLGQSPGALALNTTTAAGMPSVIKFTVSGGAIHIAEDGTDLGPLTLPDVTVSNLVFRQITTGVSQAVKIEMTLSTGSGSFLRSYNFYDTAILRDSY